MKILIVEDDFVARRIMNRILSSIGECDVAVNGKEALEVFTASLSARDRYDLVCLDILMPELNGMEVLQGIREAESAAGIVGLRGTKVIMTTSLNSTKNVFNAFKAGCECYLIKPIERAELLRKVGELGITSSSAPSPS